MPRALAVFAGREAAARLARDGWDPELFGLLLGASGGPKWFILSALDRYLFGDFLPRSNRLLAALGSSVGAWRHACLVQRNPAAAISRFAESYLAQSYSSQPDAAEISRISLATLDHLFGDEGCAAIANHPRIASHVVTARGRGACAARGGPQLALGLAGAACANALHRRALGHAFERVVFRSDGADSGMLFPDFNTVEARLTADNARSVLHASGSIPFLLTGERDIPGAPPGQYWDGGITDYHFDMTRYSGDRLALFPHFRGDLTPGWFDKFLPWRRQEPGAMSRLVLLCPHPDFVAGLPLGKIPDRGDFRRLDPAERIKNWRICMARGEEMAAEFNALVTGSDPLYGVTVS